MNGAPLFLFNLVTSLDMIPSSYSSAEQAVLSSAATMRKMRRRADSITMTTSVVTAILGS